MADTADDAGLQFDQAEVQDLGRGSVACGFCKKPIPNEYHQVNQMTACGACRQMVEASLARRPGMTGFLKAFGAGIGAAATGALVWFLIANFAHMELGIIAIAVGFAVGCAVRWGTGGAGRLAVSVAGDRFNLPVDCYQLYARYCGRAGSKLP